MLSPHTQLKHHRPGALVIELLLLVSLVTVSWLVAHSPLLEAEPQLISLAIMVDLTVTAALCHWLLGVRRGGLARWTFIPLLAVGLFIGHALLPADAPTVRFTIVLLALVESSGLVLLVVNVRKLARAYRVARRCGDNGFDAFESALLTLAPASPTLMSYVRFEVQLWTMCLVGWRFERQPRNGPNVFTHHRTSHWFALLGVLIFLVLVEGLLTHVILHSYHYDTTKWVLSALSLYGLAWLVGDLQALRVYRSCIRDVQGWPTLELRVGARAHAQIPLHNIASVELGVWERAGSGEASVILIGKANVRLAFHVPQSVKMAFGPAKPVRALLLQVDEPETFRLALRASSSPGSER